MNWKIKVTDKPPNPKCSFLLTYYKIRYIQKIETPPAISINMNIAFIPMCVWAQMLNFLLLLMLIQVEIKIWKKFLGKTKKINANSFKIYTPKLIKYVH